MRKSDGTADKHKQHLVARGFNASIWVDYFNKYSRIAKIMSFSVILAIAACYMTEISSPTSTVLTVVSVQYKSGVSACGRTL